MWTPSRSLRHHAHKLLAKHLTHMVGKTGNALFRKKKKKIVTLVGSYKVSRRHACHVFNGLPANNILTLDR